MSQYEVIDAICDAFAPLLLITVLVLVVRALVVRNFVAAASTFAFLIVGLVLVYGVKFVDEKFHIWSSFGMDYSTHTAFVLAVCVALSVATDSTVRWVVLFAVYELLVLYQEYHTLSDIWTTIFVIGGPLVALRCFYRYKNRFKIPAPTLPTKG